MRTNFLNVSVAAALDSNEMDELDFQATYQRLPKTKGAVDPVFEQRTEQKRKRSIKRDIARKYKYNQEVI